MTLEPRTAETVFPPHPLKAATLMLVSAICFGLMAVVIRLASAQLHAFEIAFFRTFFGLLFTIPLILRSGSDVFKTNKLGFYFIRCAIGTVSMLAGFWALVHLPLSQAVAISYSTPLFVTIGAVLVLHEVVRARRWSAVAIGFVGVLIILRPWHHDFSFAMLIALLSAAASGVVAISIKFLTRTEKPDTIVFYSTLIWVPLTLIPALFFWQWPQADIWPWVILSGFLGTLGHVFWTRAFQLGDVSALTPISFMQLPVVALFAWILFDERMDQYTAIGACIIFASNVYIAHREAQIAKLNRVDKRINAQTRADQ